MPPICSASAAALSPSTSATIAGSPQPRASALAMFPAPMRPTFTGGTLPAEQAYDWLKKPFSISRARSSAETSTLRGVRRKTLSAMRCMPPSRA